MMRSWILLLCLYSVDIYATASSLAAASSSRSRLGVDRMKNKPRIMDEIDMPYASPVHDRDESPSYTPPYKLSELQALENKTKMRDAEGISLESIDLHDHTNDTTMSLSMFNSVDTKGLHENKERTHHKSDECIYCHWIVKLFAGFTIACVLLVALIVLVLMKKL